MVSLEDAKSRFFLGPRDRKPRAYEKCPDTIIMSTQVDRVVLRAGAELYEIINISEFSLKK